MKRKLSVILAALLVFALSLSLTGCGSSGAAKAVVKDFFTAIDDHDSDKFLECFEKDARGDFEDDYDEDTIKSMLEYIDEYFKEEYGSKWAKDFKITDVEKGDTDDGVTEYTVTVEFKDDDDEFDVIKVKGKYYIDDKSMSSLGF